AENNSRTRSRETDKDQPSHHREQKDAAHDFNGSDNVAIERLRIHMAVAHGSERLHTEKEAIIKPMPTGGTSDTVLLETVKRGKKKIERDIKRADEHGKLRPP